MINLHYYLDTRAVPEGAAAPLKLVICKRSASAQLRTGISLRPEEWNARAQQVVNSPRRRLLNSELARLRTNVEDYLRPQIYAGKLADMSATDIKNLVDVYINGARHYVTVGDAWAAVKREKPNTCAAYAFAHKKALEFCPEIDTRPLQGITRKWLEDWRTWMLVRYHPNTAAQVIRFFRTVWLAQMRAGTVSGDPFEGIPRATVPTRKRDLTLEQLRTLWDYAGEDDREAYALDAFRLSFLLRAINPVDLWKATPQQMFNGRLYYERSKTGKAYSVKLEPEALEIIARRGNASRLFASAAKADGFRNLCDIYLRKVSVRLGLPSISMYWARHTLASLLFADGVSMDIVSAVLGHSVGAKITATYVDIRETQVDAVMRSIIDKVVSK